MSKLNVFDRGSRIFLLSLFLFILLILNFIPACIQAVRGDHQLLANDLDATSFYGGSHLIGENANLSIDRLENNHVFSNSRALKQTLSGLSLKNVTSNHRSLQPQRREVVVASPGNPSAKITGVYYPSEIFLGSEVTIAVYARNYGDEANWQTIAVSFPQNPNSVSVVSHDLTSAAVHWPAEEVWGGYGAKRVRLSYPLVEGQKSPWSGGEQHYLNVKVKPEASGYFYFYVKSVAGRQPDGLCVSWDPTSGARDQQDEYVYVYSILVVAKPSIVDVGVSYESDNVPRATPLSIVPGQRIRLWYRIYNPNSFTIQVVLGASIRYPDDSTKMHDPNDDKTVTLSSGTYWYNRFFDIPSNAPSGYYDVLFGIWKTDWSIQYQEIMKNDWLHIPKGRLYVKVSNYDDDSHRVHFYVDGSYWGYMDVSSGYTVTSVDKEVDAGYHTVEIRWHDDDTNQDYQRSLNKYVGSDQRIEYAFVLDKYLTPLSIYVQNVDGARENNAVVKRYDASWRYIDEKITDSNGLAYWPEVQDGSYNFEVYNRYGEFWGDFGLSVGNKGPAAYFFTRFMPYAYEIIASSNSISMGESITITIKVKNPSALSRTVRVKILLDSGKSSPWDWESGYQQQDIPSGGTVTFQFTWTPNSEGTYYAWTYVDTYLTGPAKWVMTDHWEWYPYFTVQMPQLDVTNFSTDKQAYNPTDMVQFSFKVKNIGSSTARFRPAVVVVEPDGTTIAFTQQQDYVLSSGQEVTIDYPVSRPGGWKLGVNRWKVVLGGPPPNYQYIYKETPYLGSFRVGPDLSVESIWTEPSGLTAGQPFTLKARIWNRGVDIATSFNVVLSIDDLYFHPEVKVINGLGSGSYIDVTWEGVRDYSINLALSSGSHTLKVIADSDGKVIEADETNNMMPLTVNVNKAKWTVLAYIGGDNDLEDCANDFFGKFHRVGSTADVNLVTLVDKRGDKDSFIWYILKQSGPYLWNYYVIMDGFEANMGSAQELESFLTVGKAFEADHYLLIIFNHGNGTHTPQVDEHPNGELSIIELRQALKNANIKIDVFFASACLMGNIETAYEIKDYVNIMVASEEVGWYSGFPLDVGPIDDVLSILADKSSTVPYELARKIVDRYAEWYNQYSLKMDAPHLKYTISAIDLMKLSPLVTAIDNLASKLIIKEASYKMEVYENIFYVERYEDPRWLGQVYGMRTLSAIGIYADIYNFTSYIFARIPDEEIRSSALDVINEFIPCVIHLRNGQNHQYSYGLSILLPPHSAYYGTIIKGHTYAQSAFASETHWDEFLEQHLLFGILDITVKYPDGSAVQPIGYQVFDADWKLIKEGFSTNNHFTLCLQVYRKYHICIYQQGIFIGSAENIFVQGHGKISIDDEPIRPITDMIVNTNHKVILKVQIYCPDKSEYLSGVTVKIFNHANELVYTDTTDTTGTASFSVWPTTKSGEYYRIDAQSPYQTETYTRYRFAQWSDGDTSNPRAITINMDQTLTAHYKTQHYLTANSNPSGLDNPRPSGWYDAGSTVMVYCDSPVLAGTGTRYVFTQWSGDISGTSTTATVYIDRPKIATANYKTQFYLTANSNPSGIDNPRPSGWYDSGTTITIQCDSPVSDGTGKQRLFTHWSGDASGTNPSTTMYMDRAKTATAEYKTQNQLTIVVSPAGGGSTNPATGTYWHDSGTSVTVSETPAAGYEFDHWDLDGSNVGSNPSCTVTMNAPHTLTAIFKLSPSTYDVTVKAHCNTEGVDISVSFTWDGTTHATLKTFTGQTGSHTVVIDEKDPNGHPFIEWVKDGVDYSTSRTITVSSGGTYTAIYVAEICNIHLESKEDNSASVNKGTITFDGTAYSLPNDVSKQAGSYQAQDNPDSGYSFDHWETSGGVSVSSTTSNPTTVTVSATGTLRAVYKAVPPPTTFEDGFESGSFSAWSGSGISSGEIATVVNTLAHHGTYSARFTSNGGGGAENSYYYKIIASSTELYARGYFYVSQSGIVDENDRFIFITFRAGSTSVACAGWKKTSGAVKWWLVIKNGTSSVAAYSSTSPSLNRWYCVELHWKKDSVSGLGELWVDGVRVCSKTGKNTAAYGNVNEVRYGLEYLYSCASTTAYTDCAKIANTYIGPEPSPPPPPTIFEDGFESGSFSKWSGTSKTYGEAASVVTTLKHHGVYSARFTSNGGGGTERSFCYKTIASSTGLYARGYFYVSQSGMVENGDQFFFMVFRAGTNDVALAGWKKTSSGVKWCLRVRHGTSWVSVNSAASPALNQWYCVEVQWQKSSTAGLGKLYVNGALVCSITGKNTTAYGNVNQVRFGLPQINNCGPTTANCDCARIASTYIGPE